MTLDDKTREAVLRLYDEGYLPGKIGQLLGLTVRELVDVLGARALAPCPAPEQTMEATITIEVKVDEGREASITVTSRPMVPALNIAELLEKIAVEIRAGRLDSLKIRDIG